MASVQQDAYEGSRTLWDELVAKHARLQQLRQESKDTRQERNLGTRTGVLLSKLRLFQAELQELKEREPTASLENIDVTVAETEHEVHTSFIGLTNALNFANERLLELEKSIATERTRHGQHREIAAALVAKLDAARRKQEEASRDAAPTVNTDMRAKAKHIALENKRMMGLMNTFLQEHFPIPDAGGMTTSAGKRNKQDIAVSMSPQGGAAPAKYCSMIDLLEELMNTCMAKPHDPYITIREDIHWPMYIELIIRWGIGIKHPSKANQIKLVAFHI